MEDGQMLLKSGLSSFDLKIIAIVSMFIDHLGAIVFPEFLWMRYVGRLAFPIYAFLLTEGFRYTKNVDAYLKRLFVFAILSEVVFDYAFFGSFFYTGHQNVFFTLSFSLFLLTKLSEVKSGAAKCAWIIGTALAAAFLYTDYGAFGVMTVLVFWKFRENRLLLTAAMVLIHAVLYGGIQSFAVLALIPIFLYNGERGRKIKYFFYTFYPAHLIFLILFSQIIRQMYG